MSVQKKFLKKALNDFNVKKFLFKELERAGVSSIDIQKTPIATRIGIVVRRPGVVVGKRGNSIKDLCIALERDYKIENPQIEVIEVQNASLDARIMAEKIGKKIETKPNVKPVIRMALQEIMEAGAMGAEIRAAGKLVGKGGKAKVITVRKGLLKKSGDSMKLVHVGRYVAYLSAGAVGISVHIVQPGTIFHDPKKKGKIVEAPVLVETVAAVEVAAPAAVEAIAAEPTAEVVEAPAVEKAKRAKKPKAEKADEAPKSE